MNNKQRDLTYVYVDGNVYGYFDGNELFMLSEFLQRSQC
ncbi:hypothetical protein IIDPJIOB_00413 [Aeromonas veronii]